MNQRALRFDQVPNVNGFQMITFTFSAPVTNISLSIFDIDNLVGGWSDRIVINTTPFTFTVPTGSTVVGSGTGAAPFANSQPNTNVPSSSGQGNFMLAWAGPLTSISFRFACGPVAGGGNQLINVSDISFCR